MILDGHNDLALRVWQGRESFQVDLAAAAGVGFAGGFFALGSFGAVDRAAGAAVRRSRLDAPVPIEKARADVEGQLAALEAPRGDDRPRARRRSSRVG